jgi:hypothetical protein
MKKHLKSQMADFRMFAGAAASNEKALGNRAHPGRNFLRFFKYKNI